MGHQCIAEKICGSSMYGVGEAVAMLSLCLCASVVLLEMLAIIIPGCYGIQPQRNRGAEQIRDQMELNHSLAHNKKRRARFIYLASHIRSDESH